MRKRLHLIADEIWLSPTGTTATWNSWVLQTNPSPIKISQEVSPVSRTLLNKVWQVMNWWKLKAEERINHCSATISDAFKCLMRMNMTWVLYILLTLLTLALPSFLTFASCQEVWVFLVYWDASADICNVIQCVCVCVGVCARVCVHNENKIRAELCTLGVFSRVLWIECDKLFVKICHVCRQLSRSDVASFLEH